MPVEGRCLRRVPCVEPRDRLLCRRRRLATACGIRITPPVARRARCDCCADDDRRPWLGRHGCSPAATDQFDQNMGRSARSATATGAVVARGDFLERRRRTSTASERADAGRGQAAAGSAFWSIRSCWRYVHGRLDVERELRPDQSGPAAFMIRTSHLRRLVRRLGLRVPGLVAGRA